MLRNNLSVVLRITHKVFEYLRYNKRVEKESSEESSDSEDTQENTSKKQNPRRRASQKGESPKSTKGKKISSGMIIYCTWLADVNVTPLEIIFSVKSFNKVIYKWWQA